MARLDEFIAFRATIQLLKETGQSEIIEKVYQQCKNQDELAPEQLENFVKQIYKPFTPEQISDKIAAMLKTADIKAEINVIFQSIENLHEACPKNPGDWYFTGNYPTPGGIKVVNRAFINFYEGKKSRAY